MFDTLIKNVRIIDEPETKNGFIGIKDGKIAYISEKEPQETAKDAINGAGKAVLPGLINTHAHSSMTLMRGYAGGHALQDWLFNYIFPAEARLDEECIEVGTQLAIAEMVRTGTVSVSDMYFRIPVIARAAFEAGIYANICNSALVLDDGAYDFKKDRPYLESTEMLKSWHGADNGRIRLDAGIHAEYTSRAQTWRDYAGFAAEHGLNMQVHLSETEGEHLDCIKRYGKTPAQVLCEAGVFDTRTTAAHCVWVSGDDIELLRAKDVTAAHNPVSNLKLASGIAPVSRMLKAGMRVSLGTDGASSNNSLDMFEEMKFAAVLQTGSTRDASALSVYDALGLATRAGAYAQGRENSIGRLARGFDASLVMIDLDVPMLTPVHDAASAAVYAASGRDVCMTMVRGKILYQNGEYMTLDMEKIRSRLYGYVMPRVFGK